MPKTSQEANVAETEGAIEVDLAEEKEVVAATAAATAEVVIEAATAEDTTNQEAVALDLEIRKNLVEEKSVNTSRYTT
jgi:hypothetical protein